MTISELATKFDKNIIYLKNHIYTPTWEFHILSQRTDAFDLDDLISIEPLHLLQGDDDQHGLLSQHYTDHDLSNSSEVCRESCIRGGVG